MVSSIKKESNYGYDDDFKKNIIIVCEIAVLLTLIIVIVVFFTGQKSPFKEEATMYITTQPGTEITTQSKEDLVFSTKPSEGTPQQNQQTQQNNYTPAPNVQNNQGAQSALPNPSGWSKAEIIDKAKDAVNKTKAYTGNLTAQHSESFVANVTECSAGGIVRTVVDVMIGWIVKPVDETLVFQNGKAVNSEGETIPILLPQKNGFNLTENGVRSATVQRLGNEYLIKIYLVEEDVGMYDVPKHNASSVGYLDVANFDLSFMEVDSADIVYQGSSIELRINADGYVTYASYVIPLHIEGSAHKGSISGSATFDGEQTEKWILNY